MDINNHLLCSFSQKSGQSSPFLLATASTELVCTAGTELVCTAGTELVCTAGTELVCTAGTELVCTAGTELVCTAGTELVRTDKFRFECTVWSSDACPVTSHKLELVTTINVSSE